jgi:hypothetical protein
MVVREILPPALDARASTNERAKSNVQRTGRLRGISRGATVRQSQCCWHKRNQCCWRKRRGRTTIAASNAQDREDHEWPPFNPSRNLHYSLRSAKICILGPLAGDACRAAPCRTPMAPIDSCNTSCAARMTNAGLRLVNRQNNA